MNRTHTFPLQTSPYVERQLLIIFDKILPRHCNNVLSVCLQRYNQCKQTPPYKKGLLLYKDQTSKKEGKKILNDIQNEYKCTKYKIEADVRKQSFCEPWWLNHLGQSALNSAARNVVDSFFQNKVFNSWTLKAKNGKYDKKWIKRFGRRNLTQSFSPVTDISVAKIDTFLRFNNKENPYLSIPRGRSVGHLRIPILLSDRGDGREIGRWRRFLSAYKNNLALVRIIRRWTNNKWKFCCQFVARDSQSLTTRYDYTSSGKVSLDIGLHKICWMTDEGECGFIKYDPQKIITQKNRYIGDLQRKLDEIKRELNPHKYNSDGTFKKGNTGKWISNSLSFSLEKKIKTEQIRAARARNNRNGEISNFLRSKGNILITEDISIKEWQERKNQIDDSDGSTKRYKNHGKNVGDFAPGMLLAKCEEKFSEVHKVNVYKAKPSRHCPLCGKFNDNPEYTYKVEIFECPSCGFSAHRDLIANINLHGIVSLEKGEYSEDLLLRVLAKVDTSLMP